MQTVTTLLLGLAAVPVVGAGLLGLTVLAERRLEDPDSRVDLTVLDPAPSDPADAAGPGPVPASVPAPLSAGPGPGEVVAPR